MSSDGELAPPTLSPVERHLLGRVLEGRSLTVAGWELGLTPSAVAVTMAELRTRFGVSSTAALAAAARVAGSL